MNKFKTVLALKLLFPCPAGKITMQDLFDLPLSAAATRPSLDGVAIALSRQIKELADESFVVKKSNKSSTLELQLDIVKEIIADRQNEVLERAAVADKRAEKAKLLEILSRKQDAGLESLSEEDIKSRIAAL